MNGLNAQQQANYAGASIAGSNAPRAMGEIEGEMSSIENAISRLSARSEMLRTRLQSISRPPQPATASKALAPVQATDLGRALASFAERVNMIADSVDDDTQRLAL